MAKKLSNSFFKTGIITLYVKPQNRKLFGAVRIYAEKNFGSLAEFMEVATKMYIEQMTTDQKEHFIRAQEQLSNDSGDTTIVDKALYGNV
jgi:hypothetical protein